MKRTLSTAAAALACAAVVPSAAAAAVVELGSTTTPLVAPSCPAGVAPANCTIILTRVTAMETLRDGVAYPTRVKQSGRIVAFTLGLSRLSTNAAVARNDIHLLDASYGGTTRLAVTVLRPTGASRQRRFTIVAQSPAFRVQPYLGQVVQFPLTASLPVAKGDVVGLTTSTWAPVLSIDVASKSFAYRQSRNSACTAPPASSAAQSVGQVAVYGCNYPGTRVEYSATEVTDPTAAKPIHARISRR